MKEKLNRRDFGKNLALGLGVATSASAQWQTKPWEGAGMVPGPGPAPAPGSQALTPRHLKVGHTGITWGYRPDDAPKAIADVGRLGYWAFESFGSILEYWEPKGGLKPLLDKYNLPLYSCYCGFDMLDPSKLKGEIQKMVRWGKLIKSYGGKVSVMGPTGVDRKTFDFKVHKAAIVNALNETAKALADIGITAGLHQHTGTCVMRRHEVYEILDAVDTRYVKAALDLGQLTKAGSDPVPIVEDFLPIMCHVHVKDFNGSYYWNGYCPTGQGEVDIPKILDLLESSGNELRIMVELDPPWRSEVPPITAYQTAAMSKWYFQQERYTFQNNA
jgi:inosose dehydratase